MPPQHTDSDDLSHMAEQFTGTNPRSHNSRFCASSIIFNPSNKPVITFDLIASKTYRLEYKTNITDANWLNAGLTDLTTATTGPAQFIDTFVTIDPKLLYRVILLIP